MEVIPSAFKAQTEITHLQKLGNGYQECKIYPF